MRRRGRGDPRRVHHRGDDPGGDVIYVTRLLAGQAADDPGTYRESRHRVARALLLGLEILVAADSIRTVALEPTLGNVLILGLLIVIRTFLSWGLVVEIEERWPWQPRRAGPDTGRTSAGPV